MGTSVSPWRRAGCPGTCSSRVKIFDGRAVQVDPIKPTLIAPGPERLKLKRDKLLSTFVFKFNLCRFTKGPLQRAGHGDGGHAEPRGRAVQVDPMKPKLKPPGTKRLKLTYDELLSNFPVKFKLRR
jgi:hypothetical protein